MKEGNVVGGIAECNGVVGCDGGMRWGALLARIACRHGERADRDLLVRAGACCAMLGRFDTVRILRGQDEE